MLEYLRPDGNMDYDPATEPIYAAIEAGVPADWAGETGQGALHRIDRDGSRWLFFSAVEPKRFFVYAKLENGRKVYAVGDDPAPQGEIEIVIAGRGLSVPRWHLVAADQAAMTARCFVEQHGTLYPAMDWLLDGQPYWPEIRRADT
jgi:hypothetical protein